jgi:hypothetical protein
MVGESEGSVKDSVAVVACGCILEYADLEVGWDLDE